MRIHLSFDEKSRRGKIVKEYLDDFPRAKSAVIFNLIYKEATADKEFLNRIFKEDSQTETEEAKKETAIEELKEAEETKEEILEEKKEAEEAVTDNVKEETDRLEAIMAHGLDLFN